MALERVIPKPEAKYTVLVYFLTDSETIEATDTYGGIIVMGTYANKSIATSAAQAAIDATGHRNAMVIRTCQWHFLKPEIHRDSIVVPAARDMLFGTEARISAELDLDKYKTSTISREELAEQALKARNPDYRENYDYRIGRLNNLKQRLAETQSKIEKLGTQLTEQLTAHPEFQDH